MEPLNSTEGLDLMTSPGATGERGRGGGRPREREREKEGGTNQSRADYDLNFIQTQLKKVCF